MPAMVASVNKSSLLEEPSACTDKDFAVFFARERALPGSLFIANTSACAYRAARFVFQRSVAQLIDVIEPVEYFVVMRYRYYRGILIFGNLARPEDKLV
jgi:hypothetical protein